MLSILLLAAGNDVPASLAQTIAAIQAKPLYAHSTFGIFLADRTTGATLIDRLGEGMYVPGSIMKTYSTAAVLDAYGPDYRFRTPVYRSGSVTAGTLDGNLVLVAAGDFSFGLRDRPDGTLAFNSMPELDHNYADTGFPGAAIVKGSDPLAALDELARGVRASGIRRVRGNVLIDDRLFATYKGWPDGTIAPIWVNENVIDIFVTPSAAGRPARVDWRPKTASLRVVSTVTTVASGANAKALAVEPKEPGVVEISGEIAAGDEPALRIAQIPDPAAFARIALIEALRRAGVAVSASASGPNPVRLLPDARTYSPATMVAQHVSPPLAQFVKVILKVSYNRGADLMVCLVAVNAGSRDCAEGLAAEVKTIEGLGVSDGTVVYDGAGSVDSGRTSPADEVTFLRNLLARPWGRFVHDGMAILGVDGTQATNQVGTPAAGKVRVKDGSRVTGSPSGQIYMPAKTQVGYMETRSGRQLVYAVFINGVPMTPATVVDRFMTADHDIGAIVTAIQQAY